MGVRQISVFLENKSGQLAHICRIIADAGINMKALNIAETSDYGVVRLITDKPDLTVRVLSDEDYHKARGASVFFRETGHLCGERGLDFG